MCGICGKLNFDRAARVAPSLLRAMADSIYHRGPDDDGYYFAGPVGFGFRRLAIIDLNTGHQPISNEDGTVWIVFNGEIYNYRELRHDLLARGHSFKTQTDTEVIIHLYEEFGEACVPKLRGMFAFAIWDERRQRLFLARDRVGIKPLYYAVTHEGLIFGSEIKAILKDPAVSVEVEPGNVARFLAFDYVPGEETLFRGIKKLQPGSYITVQNGNIEIKPYWDLDFTHSGMNLREAEQRLVSIVEEAVQQHMIADVPVGFLLSGGVDSTAMLDFAAGETANPISSFTIGFSAEGITDERPYARLAARTYGSDHHEMTIGASEFRDFLPEYIWHMEEPVCEPPAVALYYVCKLAKKFVKVLISGEGGDEAFGGYQNYRNLLWLERFKSLYPPMNGAISSSIFALNRVLRSSRISKYVPLLTIPFEEYYFSRTSNPFRFFRSQAEQIYSPEFANCTSEEHTLSPVTRYLGLPLNDRFNGDRVNRMLYVDTKTWLPDDLLLKADKMTMANSIELRVPLLDHKLLEFAASLPGDYKVRAFTTKYIAKRALQDRVPRTIRRRKKTGFPVPYGSWLRKDLKDWVHNILLDPQTLARGYFKKNAIENLLLRDLASGGYSKELFSLITLELWHRTFLTNQRGSFINPTPCSQRASALIGTSRSELDGCQS